MTNKVKYGEITEKIEAAFEVRKFPGNGLSRGNIPTRLAMGVKTSRPHLAPELTLWGEDKVLVELKALIELDDVQTTAIEVEESAIEQEHRS